jgi:hypothetical protein
MMADRMRKWLRQQSKDFYAAGFEAPGQVYQCWWRICRERNVLSRFEYLTFYVSYPFVTYLLTLPRTITTVWANLQSDHRCTRHKLVEGSPSPRKGTTNLNWAQWNNIAWTETEIRISRVSTLISLLPTGYCGFAFCLSVGSLFLLTVWWILAPPEWRFNFHHPAMIFTFLIDIFSVTSRWCYFTSTEIYISA